MSNESMSNQITDVPSAIAELLAVNKYLEQQLEAFKNLAETNKKLGDKYFEQLKEAVSVIEFVADENTSGWDNLKCARQFLAKYRGV